MSHDITGGRQSWVCVQECIVLPVETMIGSYLHYFYKIGALLLSTDIVWHGKCK